MSAERIPARLALLAGVALIGAGALAGCGTQGDLQRPAPYFGESAKRQYQSDQAAGLNSGTSDVDAASSRKAGPTSDEQAERDENTPRTKRDIQDPAQKLTPLSASPLDGAPNLLGRPVSTRPPG
jgi:hypothetical protein